MCYSKMNSNTVVEKTKIIFFNRYCPCSFPPPVITQRPLATICQITPLGIELTNK